LFLLGVTSICSFCLLIYIRYNKRKSIEKKKKTIGLAYWRKRMNIGGIVRLGNAEEETKEEEGKRFVSSTSHPYGQDYRRRSVLLIYAEDSCEHCEAVDLLAEICRDRFHLDPIHPRWQTESIAQNKAIWINRAFAIADLIVVVHSFGARLRYEAMLREEEEMITVKAPSAQDQLFSTMIASLFTFDTRLIHVRFDNGDDQCLIWPLTETVFVLPKHSITLARAIERITDSRLSAQTVASDDRWQRIARLTNGMVNRQEHILKHHIKVSREKNLPPSLKTKQKEEEEEEKVPLKNEEAEEKVPLKNEEENKSIMQRLNNDDSGMCLSSSQISS